MNIRELKEATTAVVGMPLAFIAAAVATVALALNWIGVSAIERFVRR